MASEKRGRGKLTAREIEAAIVRARRTGKDQWLADPGARGEGRFMVRCTKAGARAASFRYTLPDGRRDTYPIGMLDPTGTAGATLVELREKAGELSRLYQSGVCDLRAHFAEAERARLARAEAERAAQEAAQRHAERGSLAALLAAYVATLGTRPSARDAGTLFRLHVTEAFPELAAQPAAAVEAEDLRDVLARLIEAGKGRTAAKLRSYLRAAYSLAMRALLDPTVPGAFADFAVKHNPSERLPALSQFNLAHDRALTLAELRAFWTRLTALPPSAARDAAIACVLLGGQRPAQLLRITPGDLDIGAATLRLLDPKGRNRAHKPRPHVLPVVPELVSILERRRHLCETTDAPLFSTGGKVPVRPETVTAMVGEICRAMKEAGELERGAFRLGDLRRTAETHMAAIGISRDVRAQVQSHGLGGVQQRHYDKHDYASEKLDALMRWADRLYGRDKAAVVPLRRQGRAA